MIRSIFVLCLLQLASNAAAQDSDSPYFAPALSQLPSDLKSYLSAQATGTAVANAIIGDYVTEPETSYAGERHGPLYTNPASFIQEAQTRFLQFAATSFVPDDQKSVLVSVVGVISAAAATDGLLGSAAPNTTQTNMVTSRTSGTTMSTATTVISVNSMASSNGGAASTQAPPNSTSRTGAPTSSNGAMNAVCGMAPATTGLQLFVMSLFAMFA